MAEFPELLSIHCEDCSQLSFLPYLCKLCRCFYCDEHRLSHKCKPDENQLLVIPKSASGQFKQFLCSKTGCFEMEWTKLSCSLCNSHFCMEHRICEDHECKGLLKTDKIKQEQKLPTINTEIVIKAPKKNNDPIQQARIDKVAAMRLKAKNTFKIPLSDAIIVFVNPQNSDRFPCMISKDWTVNRCKSVIVEQSGLKDPTSYTLYSEEETLLALKLDDKVGNCLKDMQDVHLLVNQT